MATQMSLILWPHRETTHKPAGYTRSTCHARSDPTPRFGGCRVSKILSKSQRSCPLSVHLDTVVRQACGSEPPTPSYDEIEPTLAAPLSPSAGAHGGELNHVIALAQPADRLLSSFPPGTSVPGGNENYF